MSSWSAILTIALAPAIAIALAACGGDDEDEGARISAGGVSINDHGTKDVRGKQTVELEADSFYFEPTFLRGSAGAKVKFVVENESKDRHNLSVPAAGVDRDIDAGAKVEIEVTFPSSGAVLFFCKFHTEDGMNGGLLIGDAGPHDISATGTPPSAPGSPGQY